MSTANTSLKIVTPAGDSNITAGMVVGKFNTYHHSLFIVAGSLLTLLVLIAGVSTSSAQYLRSSTHKITDGAVALTDFQLDSAKLAPTKDMFGIRTVSKTDKRTI